MVKIAMLLLAISGLSISSVIDSGGAYTVTQVDAPPISVPKDPASSEYQEVRRWLQTHALASPAPTPAPKYDAQEAVRLQLELLAISKELSEHTSAPAGLADLEAATWRRLHYIRTLQAAPVSVPDSLSTTR